MLRRTAPACLLLGTLLALPAAPVAAGGQAGGASHETGRKVFLETAQPTCATCHALADADAKGAVGPNLDHLAPSAERVRAAVAKGIGVMPAFEDSLSEAQIDAVASYVADVAGSD